MKFALVFLVHCLIAAGLAKPAVFLGYQDSLGQYSFGYSAPGSARSEVRTSNGATRGTYSYVDESGVIQTAQYVADGENGFRVFATNLPQAPLPVQDTPEVMAARTAHLQALELATRRDEEAQERKLEGDQGDANLGKTQEQFVEAKLVKLPLKEKNENSEKVELKKDNDESLQAVASRSGVEKTSENTTQDIREVR
ncbi:cuticle protein 6 [Lasius niger]|uniref:Cuticle protein 6 n=1 Tax=Lasius niger TaxID=67767 RepID=A0A0J7KS75_LASNI|nr:cuticle protein 6 [Lasius niger]